MKIAGEKPSQEINAPTYPLSGEEYQRERINGNIEKAKALGQQIAQALVDNSESAISEQTEAAIESQKILLYSVTATTAFETYCPNQVTANTALNAFFDRLKVLDESIYEDCCDSGAYSFYFLPIRAVTILKDVWGRHLQWFADMTATRFIRNSAKHYIAGFRVSSSKRSANFSL
ncbi:MAG: hypothetical protein KBS41_00245 [Oscillospiraceae bacterium]|nr:hypothetical protein [Candidatus Equicaccousia limihippi]